MTVLRDLKQRREARRWQRLSEVEPLDDYARRFGIGAALAAALFGVVIVLVVVGLVVGR